MYVLDTNTLIYFFKGMGRVAYRLLNESPKAMSIPAIVLFELQVGIQKSSSPRKRIGQLREIVSVVKVLPFGIKEADSAALVRARLESKGRSIGPYDVLIAGTALTHHATLVTHNTAEFGRIENLTIEDWY
jgi:tRNA(fMet)-specific endonuclease VapC